MSFKRRQFSPEFKAKVILLPLASRKTTNETISKYNILPKSLIVWNKGFLENASVVFGESVSYRKCKKELKVKNEKTVGPKRTLGMTVTERDLSVSFRRPSGVKLIIEKDPMLLMWYYQAAIIMGGE
ncbi:MAG: transposase [bacterium]